MERLSLDAFTKYTFLSGLACAPEDGTPAFLCAKADTGENGYLRDLWVLKDRDTPLRLTGDGKTGAFLWDSADTLLFTSSRSEEGKKKREAGEERTDFYRISLHGGEAEEAFSVPLSVIPLEKVREGVYLLQADWDMRYSKAYTLSGKAKEALLAEKKEEEDYHVLDELPFYFNGQGFINKRRTALFLYHENSGSLTRITPETFAAGSARLDESREKILYTGES